MSASPRILALLLALAPCLPTPARAQAPADSDSESDSALVLQRADSARAVLVQPPGEKGPSFTHFVRAPFHLLGATLALGVGAGYAIYQLFDEAGLVDGAADLDRKLDARGIHVGPDFIGSRSWPALRVRWDAAAPLFVEAGASLRGYTLLRGGITLGDTLTGLELAGGRHDMNQLHFWGVGPDSDPLDRSDYQLVRSEAGLVAWFPIASHMRVRVGGGVEQNEIGRGQDDRRPDVQDVFADSRFAVGRDRFARGAADLDLDFTRLAAGDQLSGARLLGGWSLYRGIDDTDTRFQTARADLRLFAPVSTRHALALRGLVAETFDEEGGSVPFYHLPALGDDDGLRGFRSWRFRDSALAAATAEWRYRVWYHPGDLIYRLDAMAFVDHGMVAPSLRDVTWRGAETTPGIGLRFVKDGRGMAEGFAAWGGEQGLRWGFQMGSTF